MSLEAKGLTLQYDDRYIFKNLDIKIEDGEFITLIGRSGIGKSTLLHTLGSFIQAEKGMVLMNGIKMKQPDMNRLMVFQSFDQLFPWKTVEENILFPIKHSNCIGMDVEVILEKLGLSDARDLYPGQLSGGMKQRVALGRAIISKPSMLLMDEPFGSLDVATRQSMQKLIVNLWQEFKISIVFVTHDVNEAVTLGDRILIMGEAGLLSIDNPIQRPRSESEINFQYFAQEIIQRII
jgi:NitT/TauT family transport system ATP-binding protein